VKPGIEALTLDFYNTLVFHRSGRGRGAEVAQYLGRHGLDADPWTHQVLYDLFERHAVDYSPGMSAHEKALYHRQLTERLFGRLHVRAAPSSVAEHAESLWNLLGPGCFEVFPEVPDVLQRVRSAGVPLAIVSNWQCGLGHFCVELGIDVPSHRIIASAEVGSAKPDPAIFHEACRRLDVPCQRVLHVGDSLVDDLAGAENAGLQAVVVDRAQQVPAGVPTIPGLVGLPALLDLI
jgi:HAD superfamily hydrolase (TIGR01549 family)